MMEDIFDINYSFSHFFIFKDFVIPYFYFTSSVQKLGRLTTKAFSRGFSSNDTGNNIVHKGMIFKFIKRISD